MDSNIKIELTKLHASTPENITTVGWGKKITGGVKTDEQVIMYGVQEKKPLDQLPEEDRIPSLVTINGVEYKTDVIETGTIEALACDATTEANCYGWEDTPPSNQSVIRPIKGGLQIGGKTVDSGSPQGAVGTLGLLAVDSITNSLVGITNAHVALRGLTGAGELFQNEGVPNPAFGNSPIPNRYYYKKKLDWIHQGPRTGGYTNAPPQEVNPYDDLKVGVDYGATYSYRPEFGTDPYNVGRVVRHIPIYGYNAPDAPSAGYVDGTFYNDVDVAVIGLKESVVDINESWKQQDLGVVTVPPVWATTSEIDNLVATDPLLYSSGRTTGAKGVAPCGLSILSVGSNITVFYRDISMNPPFARFKNTIAFTRSNPDCPSPVAPGDSGSSLLADIGGTIKVVGLVFAAGGNVAYAIRIDEIASIAQVERWDGTAKNFLDIYNPEVITLSGPQTGGGDTPWVNGDYWYAGAFSSSAATPLHLL